MIRLKGSVLSWIRIADTTETQMRRGFINKGAAIHELILILIVRDVARITMSAPEL